MELTGLILSGGESKRMGCDKGLQLKDGVLWVKIMERKLIDLGLSVKISINSSQIKNYKETFADKLLIIDQLEIPGPLRGILSAHLQYPEKNWLVLACDMIDMDAPSLHHIINASEAKNETEFDFYNYRNIQFYEPFCAIYTAKGLAKVYADYQNNHLENFSMQAVFKTHQTFSLVIDEKITAFNNYNSN